MRNLLSLICTIAVLFVCWMMLREMKVYQEQIDVLVAKVEAMESAESKTIEDVVVKGTKPKVKASSEKTKLSKKEEPLEQKTIDKDDIVITQYKKDYVDDEEIITFKNNTSDNINRIKGILVYKDLKGNDISYQEINISISIAPGMSKQTKIRSFDQDNKYCYHKEYRSYLGSSITPFKFEFRLISYN